MLVRINIYIPCKCGEDGSFKSASFAPDSSCDVYTKEQCLEFI